MEPPYPHSMNSYGGASISPTTPYGQSSTAPPFHQSTSFATNANEHEYFANQNQGYGAPQGTYQQHNHMPMESPSNFGPVYPTHSTQHQLPNQYPPQPSGLPALNGGVPQYVKSTSVSNNAWDNTKNHAAPPFTRGMSATSNASSSTPAPTASELVSPASEPSVRTPASTESFPTSTGAHTSVYSSLQMAGPGNYQHPSYAHHQPHFALPPASVPSSPAVPLGGVMGGPRLSGSQPPPLQDQFTGKTITTQEDLQEYKMMFDAARSQTSRRSSIPNGRSGVPAAGSGGSSSQSRRSSVAPTTAPVNGKYSILLHHLSSYHKEAIGNSLPEYN